MDMNDLTYLDCSDSGALFQANLQLSSKSYKVNTTFNQKVVHFSNLVERKNIAGCYSGRV
jgi:hypothetical protein